MTIFRGHTDVLLPRYLLIYSPQLQELQLDNGTLIDDFSSLLISLGGKLRKDHFVIAFTSLINLLLLVRCVLTILAAIVTLRDTLQLDGEGVGLGWVVFHLQRIFSLIQRLVVLITVALHLVRLWKVLKSLLQGLWADSCGIIKAICLINCLCAFLPG